MASLPEGKLKHPNDPSQVKHRKLTPWEKGKRSEYVPSPQMQKMTIRELIELGERGVKLDG